MKLNENCLLGYKCPACASQGPFLIRTLSWMLWDDDGTEADIYTEDEVDFDENAAFVCKKCNHAGKEPEFNAEKLYIVSGGRQCPYCNAEDEQLHTNGPVHTDGPDADAWQAVSCAQCGMSWQDLYKLNGLGNFPAALNPGDTNPCEQQTGENT